MLESSPYEPFVRGFDYVRLASITAGMCVGAWSRDGCGMGGKDKCIQLHLGLLHFQPSHLEAWLTAASAVLGRCLWLHDESLIRGAGVKARPIFAHGCFVPMP